MDWDNAAESKKHSLQVRLLDCPPYPMCLWLSIQLAPRG